MNEQKDKLSFIPSLDEKGMEMINTAIDRKTASGLSLADAMVDFCYEPPAFVAPCEIKKAKYGNGVFATRDIKKGEVVTLYPSHGYFSAPDKKGGRNGVDGTGGGYDSAYCVTHFPTNTIHQGDKKMADPLFLGHIVNDFCPFAEEFKDKNRHGETMMKYFLYGITYQNVEYDMGEKYFVSIKASKDIKAGEELLAAYSPTYWANKDTAGVTETVNAYIKSVSKTDPKKALFLATKFKEYFERK